MLLRVTLCYFVLLYVTLRVFSRKIRFFCTVSKGKPVNVASVRGAPTGAELWYCCNDNAVSRVPEGDVTSSIACMLYYVRQESE